jgi:hypothetical protein
MANKLCDITSIYVCDNISLALYTIIFCVTSSSHLNLNFLSFFPSVDFKYDPCTAFLVEHSVLSLCYMNHCQVHCCLPLFIIV